MLHYNLLYCYKVIFYGAYFLSFNDPEPDLKTELHMPHVEMTEFRKTPF